MSRLAKLQTGDRACHQVSRHSCEILEILPWHTFTLVDLVTGEVFQTRARTDFMKRHTSQGELTGTLEGQSDSMTGYRRDDSSERGLPVKPYLFPRYRGID